MGAPHVRGGACRSPPIINLRFTAFRQKGGAGKRFTWSPLALGAWETQGASPRPWEARPRGTLRISDHWNVWSWKGRVVK